MKKLFLYVLLFVGIFRYAFCLQMNILNNVCRKKRDRSWNLQRIPFPLTQNGKTMDFGRDSEWTCDSVRGRYATGV